MQNKSFFNRFDFLHTDPTTVFEKSNESYEKFLHQLNQKSTEQDIIVLSQMRFSPHFERARELFSRFSQDRRVYFIEAPILTEKSFSYIKNERQQCGVQVIVPMLRKNIKPNEITRSLTDLIDSVIADEKIENYVLWYYSPEALAFSKHLTPSAVIYDCQEDISKAKIPSQEALRFENELFRLANVVLTNGQTLYENKRKKHHNIYPFPNSTDIDHFKKARNIQSVEPHDQKSIPFPRIGFWGDLDAATDLKLIEQLAEKKPQYQFVILGKSPESEAFSKQKNIHILGEKSKLDLPHYLAGWDAAIFPFSKESSSVQLKNMKTLELLAAGVPVVSSFHRDVERPFAESGLVNIAATSDEFLLEIEKILRMKKSDSKTHKTLWLKSVEETLAELSWEAHFKKISTIVRRAYNSQYRSNFVNLHSEESEAHIF